MQAGQGEAPSVRLSKRIPLTLAGEEDQTKQERRASKQSPKGTNKCQVRASALTRVMPVKHAHNGINEIGEAYYDYTNQKVFPLT